MAVRPLLTWTAAIGGLALYDYRCHLGGRGNTLSEVTRATLRTHTRPGQVAFLAGWGTLSVWFVPHILRKGAEGTASVLSPPA